MIFLASFLSIASCLALCTGEDIPVTQIPQKTTNNRKLTNADASPSPSDFSPSNYSIPYLYNVDDICGSVDNAPNGHKWFWSSIYPGNYQCSNGLVCGYYDYNSYWLTCNWDNGMAVPLNTGQLCGFTENTVFTVKNSSTYPTETPAPTPQFVGISCNCGDKPGACLQVINSQSYTCQC
jgi:hypothetical protein